jgi:hypothetical protein
MQIRVSQCLNWGWTNDQGTRRGEGLKPKIWGYAEGLPRPERGKVEICIGQGAGMETYPGWGAGVRENLR